jgi:molecular chaperone DnaJ
MKNYYEILGISKEATAEEIKKSYRKLSLQYHPDKNPDGESRFKELSEAYSILGDEEKRSKYDSGGMNMEDMFSNGGNPFDMFGDLFGGRGFNNSPRTRRGKDLNVNLNITLEESYFGKDRALRFNRVSTNNKMCGTCKGHGVVQQMVQHGPFRQMINSVCVSCQGNGFEGGGFHNNEEIKFSIPRGIDDGLLMKLRGKGNSVWGGIDGDLLIKIRILPHSHFKRAAEQLHYMLDMNFVDICLGKEILINHFDGPIKVDVPPNSDFKKPLRVKEKGFYDSTGFKGDLYVFINPTIPQQINQSEIKLLEEIKKEENFN